MASDDVMRSSARIASWEALVGRDQFQLKSTCFIPFKPLLKGKSFQNCIEMEGNPVVLLFGAKKLFPTFWNNDAPQIPRVEKGEPAKNAKSASSILKQKMSK